MTDPASESTAVKIDTPPDTPTAEEKAKLAKRGNTIVGLIALPLLLCVGLYVFGSFSGSDSGSPKTSDSISSGDLSFAYTGPVARSGDYAGFAVAFTNKTDKWLANPQTEVMVDLGGREWNCQGYRDEKTGKAVTGVMDVAGSGLMIPPKASASAVIYCRIPEGPLDSATLRLR